MDTSDQTKTDAERGQVNTDAAEIYEAFFVPALFGQFATETLTHAGLCPGERLLDVGCGTGAVARAAVDIVGPSGQVTGLDPNDGMLAVAARLDASIRWRSGVAESIPLADGAVDRTVSQFAAMFFTDRDAAVREMARVTRPGGTVTLATWAGLDRSPGYEAMVTVIEDELGPAAADALRAPFVLGDAAAVTDLVAPVAEEVVVSEVTGTARFPSIAAWVHTDVRGWTLADLVDDEAEATLVARAEQELVAFTSPDGAVRFPAPAWIATATTPG